MTRTAAKEQDKQNSRDMDIQNISNDNRRTLYENGLKRLNKYHNIKEDDIVVLP